MATRTLDFPVFDADNHLYETTDAFTKFLPPEYDGLIQYVEVNGRTKIAVKGQISEYIPNPTFSVVAAPGAQEEYFKNGNPEGKSRREIMGKPIKALPGFMAPEPRLEPHGRAGHRPGPHVAHPGQPARGAAAGRPAATHAVVHALNQWMHEHWTFNYENRIFPTPVIHLGIVDQAIKELEWVLERGARIILVRPAPVWGFMGPRSMALPEFDPFWQLVADAGILVGMHASDSGYQRYLNEWEGITDEMTPFKGGSGFQAIIGHGGRAITDTVASLIGHGLCSRFPDLRFAPVENGSQLGPATAQRHGARLRSRHPTPSTRTRSRCSSGTSTSTRSTRRTRGASSSILGADRILFGSDYPHPEGMADPISFVDELEGLPHDDVAKIMGGNLSHLMKLDLAS